MITTTKYLDSWFHHSSVSCFPPLVWTHFFYSICITVIIITSPCPLSAPFHLVATKNSRRAIFIQKNANNGSRVPLEKPSSNITQHGALSCSQGFSLSFVTLWLCFVNRPMLVVFEKNVMDVSKALLYAILGANFKNGRSVQLVGADCFINISWTIISTVFKLCNVIEKYCLHNGKECQGFPSRPRSHRLTLNCKYSQQKIALGPA